MTDQKPLTVVPISIFIGKSEIRASAILDSNEITVYLDEKKGRTLRDFAYAGAITGFELKPIIKITNARRVEDGTAS